MIFLILFGFDCVLEVVIVLFLKEDDYEVRKVGVGECLLIFSLFIGREIRLLGGKFRFLCILVIYREIKFIFVLIY